MREPMKKHPTEEARFRGNPAAIARLREMENGKRGIGKENARKLAPALNAEYRLFL